MENLKSTIRYDWSKYYSRCKGKCYCPTKLPEYYYNIVQNVQATMYSKFNSNVQKIISNE